MNKRRILLSIMLITIIALAGCGKKESEPKTIAQGEIDLSELEEDILEEAEENEEDVEEVQEEQVISYECMEEIKEASPDSGLVQIDDMLLQYGCKMSEAIDIIENSQSFFEYYDDYNENELVISNGIPIHITFLKDDDYYFALLAENLSNETISLKDCTVTRIATHKASKGNVFYAGFNDENSNIVTYDYIKKLMNNYQIITEATESESSNNLDIRQIVVLYTVPSEISTEGNLRVEYVFDSDTGELKTFKISD